MSVYSELKRRNVFKVAAAYVIIAWLIMQVGEVMAPALHLPAWVTSFLAFFLILGFPVALFFAWAFELTPEGLKKEKDVDRGGSIAHVTGRKLDFLVIGLLLVAVAYLAWDELRELGSEPAATRGETGAPGDEASAPSRSLAVLPFVNMSSDPEQEFFSDGITEEILNTLARVPGLKVAGRTSSFAFKGRNEDLRAIGETLGVEHILEGSVRKSGDTVRITAQLVQAGDGFHLWSQTWDRKLTDVFAIQDEISAAVLDELKAQLVEGERPHVATVDLAVYDNYLLARQKIRERKQESLEEAARLLDEVIRTDPAYAPAWAQRGIAAALLADSSGTYGTVPLVEANTQAMRLFEEALRLDPDNAEALAGTGLVHNQRGEFKEAAAVLNRALEINPSMVDAMNWLRSSLEAQEHLREAHRLAERIHQLDPLYLPGVGNLEGSYLARGEYERMEALAEKMESLPRGPSRTMPQTARAMAQFGRGQCAAAIQGLLPLLDQTTFIPRLTCAFCYLQLREPASALELDPRGPVALQALGRLGRLEEEGQLAAILMANGYGFHEHIQALAENARDADLIRFFESRWPDLQTFQSQVRRPAVFGPDSLGHIAYAYRQLGDDEKADDALKAYAAAIDHLYSEELDHRFLIWSNAYRAMLEDDHETALVRLEAYADRGGVEWREFPDLWRAFSPLKGEPRFEALRARLAANMDRQRAELGLPALERNP